MPQLPGPPGLGFGALPRPGPLHAFWRRASTAQTPVAAHGATGEAGTPFVWSQTHNLILTDATGAPVLQSAAWPAVQLTVSMQVPVPLLHYARGAAQCRAVPYGCTPMSMPMSMSVSMCSRQPPPPSHMHMHMHPCRRGPTLFGRCRCSTGPSAASGCGTRSGHCPSCTCASRATAGSLTTNPAHGSE